VRFVPDLLPVVRQHLAAPILWIADRAFCDLEQPARFTEREGDVYGAIPGSNHRAKNGVPPPLANGHALTARSTEF
jgi:hypothetical protein